MTGAPARFQAKRSGGSLAGASRRLEANYIRRHVARKITDDFTFDSMEDEILYTRGALLADPDAADLAPSTDGWMALVDAARAKDRAARAATQDAAALRSIGNRRLDGGCRDFGRDLATDLKNDRSSARWTRFFRSTVDSFIAQPLAAQAAAVLAWASAEDPVLARHSESLTRWARAANDALTATSNTVQVRGTAVVAREQVAEDLTKSRDGLDATLTQRAIERNLPRDYAASFFIQDRKKAKKTAEPTPT